MSRWNVGQRIAGGFLVVLVLTLVVGSIAVWMTSRTSAKMNSVAADLLPETDLSVRVEREILNARINFIYFVTIQKDGALENGWTRFRSAGTELNKLRSVIGGSDALAAMRPEVERLASDYARYQVLLEKMSAVVKSGQNHGPEFDKLLAEWAGLGSAMVDSAGRLSNSGQKATNDLASTTSSELSSTRNALIAICAVALLVGLASAC